VTSVDFLLCFACGASLSRAQQQSASILGLHLLWYCLSMLEISVKAFPMLVTDGATVFREEAPA